MQDIYVHAPTFGGPLRSAVTHAGPGSDENGFALHFTLGAVYPESRVHEAFADYLKRAGIGWITVRHRSCEIDFDEMRLVLPHFKADWIRGRAQVEPEIVPKAREGLIGLRGETEIILRLLREEVTVNQQSRIFLSHKGSDKALVHRFHDSLTDLGFDPWLDTEDMVAGDKLHRGLHAGMEASCAAVFFITPAFRDESFLAAEIDLALGEETARSDRFRIITLSLTDATGKRGTVPKMLKRFIFKEPATELDALREIMRGLPLRVGPIEWGSMRERTDTTAASAPRSLQPTEAVVIKPNFEPLVVIDDRHELEWHVVVDPVEWLSRTRYHGDENDLIDGPFHSDGACRARLTTRYQQSTHVEVFEPHCPRCGRQLFSGNSPSLRIAKNDVIEELQRVHRQGKRISSPEILEHANYWSTIRPAKK